MPAILGGPRPGLSDFEGLEVVDPEGQVTLGATGPQNVPRNPGGAIAIGVLSAVWRQTSGRGLTGGVPPA